MPTKKKNSKKISEEDLVEISRVIFKEVLRRHDLSKEIEVNPTEEKNAELARLEESIYQNRSIYTSETFTDLLESLGKVFDGLLEAFAKQPEEELLREGDNAFMPGILQKIIHQRNEFHDFTSHLYLPDEGERIKNLLDETIARAKSILEEKRKSAVRNFPELARKFRPPDFEMSDYYKEALVRIMQMAEKREKIAKDLKYVHPNKRKQVLTALAEMDKLINQAEQKLADRYEESQRYQRWLDGLRTMFKEASEGELHAMRVHIRENPGESPVIERLMAEEFPEE
jgi:hypothetical protein